MERNVPKLRFKEFNDEWKKRKLNSFIEKITEKNRNYKVNNVISNSAKNGLISQNDYFDKDIANQSNIDGYYIIRKNDFVYNPRKSVEAPYGPINKYKYIDEGVVSPLYLCFRIHDSNVLNNYLEYYFKSPKWHRYIYINGDQGARHDRVSIKDSDFMNMGIKIPSMQEQERIANFLTKVDKIIEKQEEKVKNLENYKKGMMQKIFSQEIRFRDENGDEYPEWEYCTIKKICSIKKKSILPKQFPKTNFYEYSMPAYDKCKEPEFVTGDMMNSSRIELSGPVILFNKLNVHKKRIWSIKEVNENSICSAEFIPIVANSINQDFLYCKLISDQITEYVKSISTGSSNSQKRINSEDLLNVEIGVPVKDEQEKISSCIINIESMVLKETEKLKELKRWKKGLLQQMFV